MRNLIITRNKKFAGCLIPYFCVIGLGKSVVDNSDVQYPIKNGETIHIPIDERSCAVAIAADTSTGIVLSEPVIISEGNNDIVTELITEYNWRRGSLYKLIIH